MNGTGLHLGRNRATGRPLVIGWDKLTDHALMLGKTGSGKSTLLDYWMRQCVKKGYGFALLDPEGTLFAKALAFLYRFNVSPDRIKLIDLTEQTHCAGLNYFALEGLTYEDKAEVVMRAISKLSQDDGEFRPLIEKYGLASLRALAKADYPLAFLYHFLHDDSVRQAILARAGDQFSTMEWASWDEGTLRDQKTELLGILNRAAIFESKMKLRALVSTRENAINWRTAMDEGQFILANLQHPSARVSRYVGILLIDQLKNATLARPEGLRPFFALVDEFAQFTSRDFLDALKRFRKREVHVVLSTQDLNDFLVTPEDQGLFESAKNNTELQIVFAMRNFEYCREMALQLFPLLITGSSIKYQGERPTYKPISKVEEVVTETESHSSTTPGENRSSSETYRDDGDPLTAGMAARLEEKRKQPAKKRSRAVRKA